MRAAAVRGTRSRPKARGGLRLRSLAIRRPRARVLVILAVLLAMLGGAWLWLRDSSLVSVSRVRISGVSGPDAPRIRAALALAARNMTTLDVNNSALQTAVAPYPVVKSLRVSTQFPHGMRIEVIEENPIGEITIGGRTVAVAGDGTLLHDSAVPRALPRIALGAPPGGARITDARGLELVTLLAAAPYQMLSRVSQVSASATHGLALQLRNGPSIYFGDSSQLKAKWVSAAAVLADSGSAGADYIDVSDPRRPVAGTTTTTASPTVSASPSATAAATASATPTTSTAATAPVGG